MIIQISEKDFLNLSPKHLVQIKVFLNEVGFQNADEIEYPRMFTYVKDIEPGYDTKGDKT